jgi:hypothetical protein
MTLSAMNYLLYDVDVDAQYYVGMLYGIYALYIENARSINIQLHSKITHIM